MVALFGGKYWAALILIYLLELLQSHICLPFILVGCLFLFGSLFFSLSRKVSGRATSQPTNAILQFSAHFVLAGKK